MLTRPAKTLGVLGGMGPAACAEFLRILARDCPAHDDSQHPKIIMLSDPETPDRSDGLMGLGPDPLPVIRRNLLQLVEWGADVLAVPCNTAHYFIDRFREELPVPLIHIVEETVKAAQELSQGNCSEEPDLPFMRGENALSLPETFAVSAGENTEMCAPREGRRHEVRR